MVSVAKRLTTVSAAEPARLLSRRQLLPWKLLPTAKEIVAVRKLEMEYVT
jgi:hypothetical protein